MIGIPEETTSALCTASECHTLISRVTAMTTTTTNARDRLATTGVWYFTDALTSGQAADTAGRIESLGYSTMWMPETVGRDPFAHIAWLGSQTETLQFATGIANIFHRHPGPMKQVANTLAEQTAGRFLLGLGVSHSPLVAGLRGLDYSKPLYEDARLPNGDGNAAVRRCRTGTRTAGAVGGPRAEDAGTLCERC